MPYHTTFVKKVNEAPVTLGTRLGRWAIYHDLSVAKISRAVGATRQSIYNWMKGGEIFAAYRPAVQRIIICLQASKTKDEAWRNVCREFNHLN